jgi:hypothetical protein
MARRTLVSALCLALLLDTSMVQAEPCQTCATQGPRNPGDPPRTTLVIWGGGATPDDADQAIRHFSSSGFSSSLPLVKLFSSEVKGLKPGFHIAVLGACPEHEAASLLRRARHFYAGIYLRRIPPEGDIAKLKCPAIKTPSHQLYFEPAPSDEPETVAAEEEISDNKYTLNVKLTVELQSNSESVFAMWSAIAELHRGTTLLETTTLSAPSFARVDDFGVDGNRIELETMEFLPDCGVDTFFENHRVRRTFSIVAGKIRLVQKTLAHESGLCEPSPEGRSDCAWRCQMASYEATREACVNVSREKCERAVTRYEARAKPCTCE